MQGSCPCRVLEEAGGKPRIAGTKDHLFAIARAAEAKDLPKSDVVC